MTHTTEIDILEPIDPERLMGALRQAIGIPSETPVRPAGEGTRFYANAPRIYSVPCGARAALDLTICPTGVTFCGDTWHERSGHRDRTGEINIGANAIDCHHTGERFYVRIRLDTAGGMGECRQCMHINIARQALTSLAYSGLLSCGDESYGINHDRLACQEHPAP